MKISDITKVIEGVLFVAGEGVDIDEFKRKYDLNDKEFAKCIDLLIVQYIVIGDINGVLITVKVHVHICRQPLLSKFFRLVKPRFSFIRQLIANFQMNLMKILDERQEQ